MKVIYKVAIPVEKTINAYSISGLPLTREESARSKMTNIKPFTFKRIENLFFNESKLVFEADLVCEERYIPDDGTTEVIYKLDRENPYIISKIIESNE